jgi:tyrosinase
MALRVRKNQADLSDDEKSRYVAAILKMKSTGVYDRFVVIHQASMAQPDGPNLDMIMWAHQRPGFLPWHRQLILDFENELQAADSALHGGAASTLTLPYWDWVHYRTRKHFKWWWGQIWGDDFMGHDGDSGKNYAVTDGPFRAPAPNSDGTWTMFYTPNQPGSPPLIMDPNSGVAFLQRELHNHIPSGELPTQKEWDAAKAITVYDSKPWDASVGRDTTQAGFIGVQSFRNVFEGFVPFRPGPNTEPELHNKVHEWVGGSMRPISSPNDPIFFLHHCNVDRLWAYWQLRNPNVPYLPDGSTPALTGPEGHNLNEAMHPWDGISRDFVLPSGSTLNLSLPTIKIRDVLNHNSLGYRYDSDPPALSSKP